MTTLYVIQPDAILSKDYEAFVVTLKQEDGTWKKHKIAAQTVNEIVLMGNPQVTGDAFTYALELGMPIHYLSCFGKYLGSALPKSSRNGQLRLAQYQVYSDPVKRLELVKTIVTAKIHNQYHVLYRHNEKDNPLKERKSLVKNQQTLDQVRGVEGLAAREYFACWQNMVGKQWTFNGRNRRPPTDPVNSLLSFAYALLQSQVMAAVNVAGLDPYIGYLHEVHHGQPAMVFDLMEEFRALIADNLVLSILNKQEIKPNDFNESLGAYRLKDNAKKTFLQAFDKKMNDEFKHPVFDYRCTYRRGIELQARLLSRHLQEGVPYKPLSLR
ncbi:MULTISPECIES: type I-D CRISPR-associated endonuclease Cas1d [Sphaerospermopsis]|uniref:CRISPR-associated endonuclease Cas1 n=1 Tax=Sphaerospermopsis reniformis TaxID=531300 RepID=A0A480A1A7_9CYAN|nr:MULTISPECIES: type I-D CRISPR-associated endonuclease Cas1d [Sphaerospermopsis]MBD2144487.1 type I-D CRISPR-associated endonuclease Cas1 [Sphaerospermopsis sp. FACHB-1194]GCL38262.1 CRISPR-associated protein Cas1 [Sphaerospermopsis reniformis]